MNKFDNLDPIYKDWVLKYLENHPECKNDQKQYKQLINYVHCLDSNDKERIKQTSGYIGIQKIQITKKMNDYAPPSYKIDESAPLYLLAKDRISFTRDINEALFIEGNRCTDKVDIDFITNGYRYKFISQDRVERMLGYLPPKRKSITKNERLTTYEKFNGRCAYCGCNIKYEEMEVDHFKSHKTNMGEDNIDNYMPACHDCNHLKVDFTIEQFKKAIKRCGEIYRARKEPMNAISDRIAIKYDLTKEDHDIEFLFEKE